MMDSIPMPRGPLSGIKNPSQGLVFMIGAMLLLRVGDTFAKLLTDTLNPVAVTMWRMLAQAAYLLPMALLMRHRLRGEMFSPVVALSGFLLMTSLTSLIGAFSAMPIATAIAIFFVEPLILTLLAGVLLGERAGPHRLMAVGVGLIGAMIIIRPGFATYGWVTLLPLISAVAYALNMILLKIASRTRSTLTMQCGTTIYAALILAVIAACMKTIGMEGLVVKTNDVQTWGLIACAGAVAATSFLLVGETYRHADATALAPFQYFEIITATALGFLIFGDFPDTLTWIGVSIVLGSGIYIFHREGQADTSAPRRKRGAH